ncbi:hypothetical protein [Clostridium massiliamazoniense]|uniref:hypothetical protein n=1 Tax=Clostridium massiliamazoniense TaxID=1347366 RepID=UPI0006D765ED|nr:hypothetical protein [Clostridium massiliamazoniense]
MVRRLYLFARAIHLIKEKPNWRVLILTYNKSLRYKLQSKLNKVASLFSEDLNNKDINIDNIEIRHFHEIKPRNFYVPRLYFFNTIFY